MDRRVYDTRAIFLVVEKKQSIKKKFVIIIYPSQKIMTPNFLFQNPLNRQSFQLKITQKPVVSGN